MCIASQCLRVWGLGLRSTGFRGAGCESPGCKRWGMRLSHWSLGETLQIHANVCFTDLQTTAGVCRVRAWFGASVGDVAT